MRIMQRFMAVIAVGGLTGLASAGERPLGALSEQGARIQQENQQLADSLASQIETSGRFTGYSVDVEADGGIVTLTGSLADPAQKATMLNLIRNHDGVIAVRDQLAVPNGPTLVVANFEPMSNERAMAPLNNAGVKAPATDPAPANGKVIEPAPVAQFPGGIVPYSDAPVVPPYSWPAYTPYNNFASLAVQTQYPAGAWPFVGPPYPYPMIPSGWRAVTLRWHHGYWWLKFRAH